MVGVKGGGVVDGIIVDVDVHKGVRVTEAVEVSILPIGVGVIDAGVTVRVPAGVRVTDTVAVGLITVGEGGSVPVRVGDGNGVAVSTGAGVGLIPIKSSGGTVGG